MTEDRIAKAIDRRSGRHIPRRSPNSRGPAGVMRNVFRTPLTQEELDDKARWLELVRWPPGDNELYARAAQQAARSRVTPPSWTPVTRSTLLNRPGSSSGPGAAGGAMAWSSRPRRS